MWALALLGSSAMAFCAAVKAPAVSLIRISHWESWIQRTAVFGIELDGLAELGDGLRHPARAGLHLRDHVVVVGLALDR